MSERVLNVRSIDPEYLIEKYLNDKCELYTAKHWVRCYYKYSPCPDRVYHIVGLISSQEITMQCYKHYGAEVQGAKRSNRNT